MKLEALDHAIQVAECCLVAPADCSSCPLRENCSDNALSKRALYAVLTDLKKIRDRYPREPILTTDSSGGFCYHCGCCNAAMYHGRKREDMIKAKDYALFCRRCGNPVKW